MPNLDLAKLPDADLTHDMKEPGRAWRVHISGVGGMGIGVVGAILVRAGHKEGYRVVFQDKKGLAIRNGGVFSQITFVSSNSPAPGTPGEGRAIASSLLPPSPCTQGEGWGEGSSHF